MRLINADALKKALGMKDDCSECKDTWKACHYDRIYSKMDFCEWIDDAPTVDAVPVVRCRDCKNWDTTWQNDWAKNYHYCPLIDGTRNGDWYCADAERRERNEVD